MPHFTGASFIKFSDWLQGQWQRLSPWQLLLLPVAALFFVLMFIRRGLYGLGILRSERLPVPVIVVGNITVGGTGKTPLVLWLVAFLKSHGYRPGIISRGYRSQSHGVVPVLTDSLPADVGDEPVLLAQRGGCPVWIGSDRVEAAHALLTHYPECNVIVSDDGLQHYRLSRDAEIAVVDGIRRFGNGLLLPAGPLREPQIRLASVDAVVMNGGKAAMGEYAMQLAGALFRNLHTGCTESPQYFAGKSLHAVAGIGNPSRFFAHLEQLGLSFVEHPFPDHHGFYPDDLQFDDADAVLMTEKDAVKCQAFASPKCWALIVNAQVDEALGHKVLEKLRNRDGCQTA